MSSNYTKIYIIKKRHGKTGIQVRIQVNKYRTIISDVESYKIEFLQEKTRMRLNKKRNIEIDYSLMATKETIKIERIKICL